MSSIIALYSSVPQSGKSTVANYLQLCDCELVKFAEPLKAMTDVLLRYVGCDRATRQSMIEGNNKTTPIYELGMKSTRHIMQTLGTEWGRGHISEDVWVDIAEARCAESSKTVVIDDMRFPNEYERMVGLGAIKVRIDRPSLHQDCEEEAHSSEGALDHHEFDFVITNDGSLEDLYSKVDACVGHYIGVPF